MRALVFASSLSLLLSIPVPAAAQLRFACTGALRPDASHVSLAKAFGAENVVSANIPVGEGETERGTIVFPNDASKRIEILWKEERGRRYPASAVVGNGSPSSNYSEWKTSKGVTLGTTLSTLERLNGGSFRLYGFGWDYAGTVASWMDGALESQGPCSFVVRLRPDPKRRSQYEGRVTGDSEFSSGHPAMRAVNPIVYQLILTYEE